MEENKSINKKGLIIGIVLSLVVIIAGTFAWYSYRSTRAAMVLTVGEIDKLRVTIKPYQFSGVVPAPSSTYNSSTYTQVTVANNGSSAGSINLFYQINAIDSALANSYFKYTICNSTSINGTYSGCTDGNFNGKTNGATVNVLTNQAIAASTTVYYRVYLWIGSSGSNQNTMSGKTFDGELRATIL